jgi:hypothetical protein
MSEQDYEVTTSITVAGQDRQVEHEMPMDGYNTAMSDKPVRFWRFSVGDLLAAVTAIGLWLGLFPTIRRIQPVIDPVFLAVVLSAILGFALAAFMGRRQSRTLAVVCLLLAVMCGMMLVRICAEF